jgi:hypothetical protein
VRLHPIRVVTGDSVDGDGGFFLFYQDNVESVSR